MKKTIILLNVTAPIIIGAVFYYIFGRDTVFVELIDNILGFSMHITNTGNNLGIKMARCYLPDFLWAYALMSAVLLFWGYDKRIIALVIIYETVLELLQLFSSVKGTFDVWDILIEILAGIIVIKLFRRSLKNEKD